MNLIYGRVIVCLSRDEDSEILSMQIHADRDSQEQRQIVKDALLIASKSLNRQVEGSKIDYEQL